jgi:hypothetical protein
MSIRIFYLAAAVHAVIAGHLLRAGDKMQKNFCPKGSGKNHEYNKKTLICWKCGYICPPERANIVRWRWSHWRTA